MTRGGNLGPGSHAGSREDAGAEDVGAGCVVYLGLGSNQGDRLANLAGALRKLREVVAFDCVSSVYETEPIGEPDQPDFLNAVARGRTSLEPRALLERALEVEREMGRVRTVRDAPRPIDVDLLLYESHTGRQEGLELPHPRLTERAFVLVPLVELDPGLVHPLTGESLADLLATGFHERVRLVADGGQLLAEVDCS